MKNLSYRSQRLALRWSAWRVAMISAVFIHGGLGAHESSKGEERDWNQARQFWSFRSPRPQTLPRVQDTKWPRQRLDYFVLSRLEKAGLKPSADTPPRVLLRRLTFDLTGLPPTVEEMNAFLADQEPGAYERVVDRLLHSPAFGERLASLWMNVARYAEDQAHVVGADVSNFYPNAYHYRRWVIDAFNNDLPYDRFIQLQLAADKIPGVDANDLPALGFLGLGPKYYNRNRLDVMADEWEDRVDIVTRSFLGLTVACARCHDHKFDPITMADYYALAGVFASSKLVSKDATGKEPPKPDKDKKERTTLDPGIMHVVEDGEVHDLHIFQRGNVDAKGPVAPRRFLTVLSEQPREFHSGSGRAELAAAIIDPHNPLTARVMANRVWGLVFGRPLVGSASNFGASGELPSHPELLDDLAVRFTANEWSVKALAREFVLSATYRQSSTIKKDSDTAELDRLWGRMPRRRLSVEQWRDSVLAVAGNMDRQGGKSQELEDPSNRRRTVYARVSRLKLDDLLTLFDYPDANVHASERRSTTTATQKLFMLNSPFMMRETTALAERLTALTDASDSARITNAYLLLYGRPPRDWEVKVALDFLAPDADGGMTRWERYAQVLLASNEMMYLD